MPLRPLKYEYELFQVIAVGNLQAFATCSSGYHRQIGEYSYLTSNLLASAQVMVQEILIKIAQRWQLFQVNGFQSWMVMPSRNHIPNVFHKTQLSKGRYLHIDGLPNKKTRQLNISCPTLAMITRSPLVSSVHHAPRLSTVIYSFFYLSISTYALGAFPLCILNQKP